MSRYHRAAPLLRTAGRWFHGTSAPEFSRFQPGEAYLTTDPDEAMGFAEGRHLGGSSGGEPRVLEVSLAPGGPIADADEEVSLIIMDEHPELRDIDGLMARLREEGYMYADFTHPGFTGGDIRVRVSLHPEKDLEIMDSPNPRPERARTSKGLDVLVESEEGDGRGSVTVTDPATGRTLGSLDFEHASDEWHLVKDVNVDEGLVRQGIATLMYDWVEKRLGRGLLPSDDQTDDAINFWTDRIGPYDPDPDVDEEQEDKTTVATVRTAQSQEHEEYYTSEACAYFALALHELYGYPLRILVDEGTEFQAGMPTVAHVYAMDRRTAVDAKGHRTQDEMRADFWDLVDPATYDVTPGELASDWMGDDDNKPLYAPSESEVAEAKTVILAEPARYAPQPAPGTKNAYHAMSRLAWSRDTLELGTMCGECGSDLDIAGRAGDPDDPLCKACHARREDPPAHPEPSRGKRWWWNASVRAAVNSFEQGWKDNRDSGRAWRGSEGGHRSGWPGLFLSFDRDTAAQYGQTAEFRLPSQTTLDIDAPEAPALVGEFYAAHPGENLNDGDPDDLFLFPPDAWVALLKGRGWTSTSIGPDIFLFDPTHAVRRTVPARIASWWSREMLDHKVKRLDLDPDNSRRFRALCEKFLNTYDMDYLYDMCFWCASFLGAACDELDIPLRVSLGQYSPEGDGFDHGWLVDSSGTPFDITAVAHAAHRRQTRSGDVTGVAAICPTCGEVTDSAWLGDCDCEDPPDPVERTKQFSDEDEMMEAGYEVAERDQYPEWKAEFVEPGRYSGEAGDAATARASELVGFDDEEEEEASAREMAREVARADATEEKAARRAAPGIEAEIEAIATEVRRRLVGEHGLEDDPPKALCLEFAVDLADELAKRGYAAGVTQGTFEVDWPDEEAYDEWDPEDFEDSEDEMSAQDVMGQAMHFPLHYWVRVTAKGDEPVGPVFADITADQFDDECDESFDSVWVWTAAVDGSNADRHQAERHDFGVGRRAVLVTYHAASAAIQTARQASLTRGNTASGYNHGWQRNLQRSWRRIGPPSCRSRWRATSTTTQHGRRGTSA